MTTGPLAEPLYHDHCRAFRNLRSISSHRIRRHRDVYLGSCRRRPKKLHGLRHRLRSDSSKRDHNRASSRQEMATPVMSGKVTFSAPAVTRKLPSAQQIGRIIRCCQLHQGPEDLRAPLIMCRPIPERLRRVGMRSLVLLVHSFPSINIGAWLTGNPLPILTLKLRREFLKRFFNRPIEVHPPIRQTRVPLTELGLSIQDLPDGKAIHNRAVLINLTVAGLRHVVRGVLGVRPSMVRPNPTLRLSALGVFV